MKIFTLCVLILGLATIAFANSPIAYWPEDGNTNDVVGGHNASATNAANFVSGKINGGLSLGSGGYIDIPDSPSLQNQQLTVTVWVRPDGAGPNNDLFGSTFIQKGVPPPQGNFGGSLGMWWSAQDNRFRFAVNSNSNAIASTNTFPIGQFYHVTGTYDGSRLRLYVNGNLEAESLLSTVIPYDSTVPWTIGSSYSFYRSIGFPRTFNGVIDEVKLYDLALSAEEVNNNYLGLLAWWPEDGHTNDIIGGHNPSSTNGVSFVSGKVSSGVTLASTGFIDIPDSPSLQNQQLTVSAWVRPDGPGPNNDSIGSTFIQKGVPPPAGNGSRSMSLWWSAQNNRFRFGIGPDPNIIASTNVFPPGQFYHVAGTYDGSRLRLYVNGNLEAELLLSTVIPYDSTVPWTIGSSYSFYRGIGFRRTWNGVIDEVKLYNQALSASEILAQAQTDIDADGIADSLDNCPTVANAEQSDMDNDGVGDACDADIDGDGVLNGSDNCPVNYNVDQTDTDNDGIGNVCDADDDNDAVLDVDDNCPLEANTNQVDTDFDGYGNACDADDDNDGVLDVQDNCVLDANPNQNDLDGDGIGDACENDTDGDGVDNGVDNCMLIGNPDQLNTDGDSTGDACDTDDDNDGIPDNSDNCPLNMNADQTNTDGDAQGDVCDSDDDSDTIGDSEDNCPLIANFDQTNADNDTSGDVCDIDDDNDNVFDTNDNCPFTPNVDQADLDGDGEGNVCDGDIDGDGLLNAIDNCPLIPNSDQSDLDGDHLGDVCDSDIDGDGRPNGSDSCPASNRITQVLVGSCNSGVTNYLLMNGCTVVDLVGQCAAGATNHGNFVSCVSHLLQDLKNQGVITGQQKGAIQSCAAQANIP